MKRVAVLTTFDDLAPGYGLTSVVLNQLRMLKDGGYDPHFLISSVYNHGHFRERMPEGITLKPVVPFCHIYDYGDNTPKQEHPVDGIGEHRPGPNANHTNFDLQVKHIQEGLEPHLIDYDVVITHDILYQGWFTTHNQAIRNIAVRQQHLRWIHWSHSAPRPRPSQINYPNVLRYSPMANSVWVSINKMMRSGFAKQYDVPLKRVYNVYNVFNLFNFQRMHPLSREMILKHHLLDCDVLCVWATRIDHYVNKGLAEAVRLIAQMNRLVHAKFLLLNSWSNKPPSTTNMRKMRKEADKWGLPQEDLIFSSEMGRQWQRGVPPLVVRDMMWIANMSIQPSKSETFSLGMIEAGACKNLLVLNSDLPVFKEIAGDHAYYLALGADWGGTITTPKYHTLDQKPVSDERYMLDRATEIVGLIKSSMILQQHRNVLQKYSPSWVFKNQLQPLIEGGV